MRSKKCLLLVAVLLVASLTLTACFNFGGGGSHGSDDMGPVVAIVNEIEITEGEVMFFVAQAEQQVVQENMEMFPDAMMALMFGGPLEIDYEMELRDGVTVGEAILKEAVHFAYLYRMIERYAGEIGIGVTDDETQMIIQSIDGFLEREGDEGFSEFLQQHNFRGRGHLEDFMVLSDLLIPKVFDTILNDPALFAEFGEFVEEEEILGAMHILINFDNHTEEEAEELATALLARARAGEDFAMLVQTYGEDPGMQREPDGYTFVAGAMVEPFYEATKALEIGEISDLVPTSFGIHIILRIEPPNPQNPMRPQGMPSPNMMAIQNGFEEMARGAETTFLPAFANIVLDQ